MKIYGYSLFNALFHLFPEMLLQKEKFQRLYSRWKSYDARRQFMDELAHRRNFDPLNTEMWYSQSQLSKSIRNEGPGLLSYHQNSFIQALEDLYPELQRERHRFRHPVH